MIRQTPDLKPAYDEHLKNNDELLPHVFFGDVTRFVITKIESSENHEMIAKLLEYLEEGLQSGDEEIENLIGVSFAENLLGETKTIKLLNPFMGKLLKKEIETA